MDAKGTELIITTYRCEKSAPGVCTDNAKEFIEPMDCKRYHEDKSGPWYMFAPAMHEDNKCAERIGDFPFNGAVMKGEYLEQYMALGSGRYRIKMLFHKLGENREIINFRGCVELDFDVL